MNICVYYGRIWGYQWQVLKTARANFKNAAKVMIVKVLPAIGHIGIKLIVFMCQAWFLLYLIFQKFCSFTVFFSFPGQLIFQKVIIRQNLDKL